jgi:hypothetical protein
VEQTCKRDIIAKSRVSRIKGVVEGVEARLKAGERGSGDNNAERGLRREAADTPLDNSRLSDKGGGSTELIGAAGEKDVEVGAGKGAEAGDMTIDNGDERFGSTRGKDVNEE